MLLTFPNTILIITAITTALIAGVFYAYSCSVNPGLGRLPHAEYIAAMQSINRAIQNPVFFISFFGTLVFLPLSAWLHYQQPLSMRFWFLLIAALFYLTGVFGVTVLGNIPLNETLESFDLKSAAPKEIASQRDKFEAPWNKLNTVRTVVSAVTLTLVILACLCNNATRSA